MQNQKTGHWVSKHKYYQLVAKGAFTHGFDAAQLHRH